MEFNRNDICEAYYMFASEWHGGQFSKEYRIFGRLQKIGFVPSPTLSVDSLSENGVLIYQNLVRNNISDYESCGECGYDHSYEPEEAETAHQKL
jgi:hypothetical protein